jgi:hypothetical protein
VLLESAIERLYDLRVGTTPVEEGSPYEKPLLKASVFDASVIPTASAHLCVMMNRPFKIMDWQCATPEAKPGNPALTRWN